MSRPAEFVIRGGTVVAPGGAKADGSVCGDPAGCIPLYVRASDAELNLIRQASSV